MTQEPPEFSSGNRYFAKALNDLGAYAKMHGVHAAGVPGWIETEDGWRPPIILSGKRAAQWRIRLAGTDESPKSEIYAGTISGLGSSGFLEGFEPDEWKEFSPNKSFWFRVQLEVSGTPYNYFSSPDQVESIAIPDAVVASVITLEEKDIDESGPEPVAPTIDPDTGQPDTPGIYWFRLGVSSVENGTSNDYLGPLGLGWCAPNSAYLTALTDIS